MIALEVLEILAMWFLLTFIVQWIFKKAYQLQSKLWFIGGWILMVINATGAAISLVIVLNQYNV